MLDPSIAAAKMYSNASRFIEAYHAVLQPLAREAELPAMALDILLFIADNPDKDTARDVCQFRGMKPGIVSVHVDRLVVIGLVGFVATFALYMFNGENKLIYYVIRPLLNKHYDSQVRDRRIV